MEGTVLGLAMAVVGSFAATIRWMQRSLDRVQQRLDKCEDRHRECTADSALLRQRVDVLENRWRTKSKSTQIKPPGESHDA